jgi:Fe-S-cluster-containing hydrogenase component 2
LLPKLPPSSRLIVSPEDCIGCRICELMCSLHHYGEFNPSLALLRVFKNPLTGIYIPETCSQCAVPACYYACPVKGAIRIDQATGARVIVSNKCEACKKCYEACPSKMIVYDQARNTYVKCDLCGGNPACVEFCPTRAIRLQP